jgi:hypothetical protein
MKRAEEKTAVASFLKNWIEQKGLGDLGENAFEVYTQMQETKTCSPLISRLVLLTLLSGIHVKASQLDDSTGLGKEIQKSCCLNQKMSDFLASIYVEVFSPENKNEWQEKAGSGLKEFCGKEWTVAWEGESKWIYDGGHVDCTGSAKVTLKVASPQQVGEDLKQILAKNPLTSAEEIFEHYQDELCNLLDSDFEEYCTAEDYYPPVVEDYGGNAEYVVTEFCQKHGLELVSSEYEGYTGDFEPDDDYRSRRW